MNDSGTSRGVILEVPYIEKNEAKHLGAKWDPEIKKWFVPQGHDTKPFRKWIQNTDDSQFVNSTDDV